MLAPVIVAAALVAYNTVANLLPLPARWYVPTNLAVAAGLAAWAVATGLAPASIVGDDPAAGLAAGLGVAAAAAAAFATLLGLSRRHRSIRRALADQRAADMSPTTLSWHILVRIPLGTVVLEEVAFRGVLLAAFAGPLATTRAVVASSVAFGLWHIGPTIPTLRTNRITDPARTVLGVAGAVVVTTVGGVGLCVLRLASASLVAPALAHWAINASGLAAAAAVHRRGHTTGAVDQPRRYGRQ
ncbi:MAG: CPBP family intramembrane metalloprotease [Actinomycetota bacterium]|nr:CPBP family intramembrane metalloprotease [Actinomycetota bacterium]